MSNIIFFDDNDVRKNLLPLTYTRPTAMLRCGITTIASKWKAAIGDENMTYSFLTVPYLKPKFPLVARRANLMIAGHMLPNPELVEQVLSLKTSLGIRLDTLNRGRRFEPAGCMEGFFEDDEALDMVGYARMFGVSAVAATSCVPVNIEVEVRKGRIAKLREEARKEAEERKRRISDFINGGKY